MRIAIQFLAVFLLAASTAQAGPERVRFHGTITDLPGVTIVDGNHDFLVRIYDQATGGNLEYSQTVTAYVAAGAYSLELSPTTAGQLSAAFADWPRFLDVTVVSGPSGSINQVLLPRQEITSVPFVLADVPTGAIILWVDGPTCPQGYAEVTALRNLTLRGADTAGANPVVPDAPNVSCTGSSACGTGSLPTQFNDILEITEMPPHTHNMRFTDGSGNGENLPDINTNDAPNVTPPTSATGDGLAHYHPFMTVLFCKRQ